MDFADDWVMPPAPEPPNDTDDRFEQASEQAGRRARLVARKVDELHALETARAVLRAEKVASTNFAEQFLTPKQLRDRPKPIPLIDRVLPRHCYAILRGRDQSFKSFVAIDWVLCLATGKPWQGHAATQARVLYIAGEGATGLTARIDAWEYAWQERIPEDMLTIRQTALNLHQPGPAFDHLLEHVRIGEYGLVIVDTLRRVSGAADGNSSEMGLVIDNLDQVKQNTADGSILVVAHTDKGDHDTRGYSGIEDDADVVWSVKRDDMFLKLELTKMKDGPDGRTHDLEAQPMNGSLILSGTSGPDDAASNESQEHLLETLRIMPPGGVTGPELMRTAEMSRSTFYRTLSALMERRQIGSFKGKGGTLRYEIPGLVDADEAHDAAAGHDPQRDDQPTLDQEDT